MDRGDSGYLLMCDLTGDNLRQMPDARNHADKKVKISPYSLIVDPAMGYLYFRVSLLKSCVGVCIYICL